VRSDAQARQRNEKWADTFSISLRKERRTAPEILTDFRAAPGSGEYFSGFRLQNTARAGVHAAGTI